MTDVATIKTAMQGRWPEVVPALTGIDLRILDGGHHPCPKCEGTDRFSAFRDFADTGGVICRVCHATENGDGVSTVMWANGWQFRETCVRLAEYAGLNGYSRRRESGELVIEYAQRKRIPVDSFRRFGAHIAKRTTQTGKEIDVVRVPMHGADGSPCSFIDFGIANDGLLKGLNEAGGKAGVFLLDGKPPAPGNEVVIVEGVKDAAALASLGYGVVGLPTCKLASKFGRLFRGCKVVFTLDLDAAGVHGARASAARLFGSAESVRIARLPGEVKASDGDGVREVLAMDNGTEMIRQSIADAMPWNPTADDGRPQVLVTPDEHLVNDAAVGALADDDEVFSRGGKLVHVVADDLQLKGIDRPEGAPRIAVMPLPAVRELLSRCVRFVESSGKDGKKLVQVHPPKWCVDAVEARRRWPGVRPLAGITDCPILRPDGTVLATPGYDRATGMLFEPTGPLPEILDRPTRADAMAARDVLLDIVSDFPFAAEVHRSSWLASLLTALARLAFSGPAPLFLIDANVRGSGKGLLADVTGIIVSGRRMSIMVQPRNDEEFRKRITSLVLLGDPLALFDNIAGTFRGASLDAALTGTVWKDRRLGKNDIIEMPLRITWYGTGNNIVLGADTSRRVCHIRLDCRDELPEEREVFRCPDLKRHVTENRCKLLAAALTILRAWFVAGQPDLGLKPWGSFEEWSDVVRNTIVWCDLPDPGQGREELRERSDTEAGNLRMLIAGLEDLGQRMTAREILKALKDDPDRYPILADAVSEMFETKDGALPSSRALGNKLRAVQGRNVGGKAVEGKKDRKDVKKWSVVDLRDAGSAGSAGSIPNTPRAGAHTCTHRENLYGEPADHADPAGVSDF